MRLSEVADYIGGVTFKPEDVVAVHEPGSVVCMRTKNVQGDLDVSDLLSIPRTLVKREEQFLREGEIFLVYPNKLRMHLLLKGFTL